MSPQQSSSGDKTEKATSKKRRDARNQGQVMKSQDVVIAISLAVLLGALKVFGPFIVNNTLIMLERMYTWEIPAIYTIGMLMPFFIEVLIHFTLIILPMLLTAMVIGVVVNVLQVGMKFTPKVLMPKFSKISPISGFKRLFSKNSIIELFKSVIKITVLGFVAYSEYMTQIVKTQGMMGHTMDALLVSINGMIDMIFTIGFKLALALIIMAPIDLFYQYRKHEKDLMMTKQEVKDEYKLTEGDPKIKGRIRQKQREMSAMRMMQAVGGADVVITNPTHYAIALQYDDSKHQAPIVIAKGKDFVAMKIKEEATNCGIPMVEDRKLAQALYFYCDIGAEVPEDMYQAVAEILAYIYRLKHGVQRQGVR